MADSIHDILRTARESARKTSGQFGTQEHTPADPVARDPFGAPEWADNVIGYTYRAENYTVEGLRANLAPEAGDDSDADLAWFHWHLLEMAAAQGIDIHDETSYDSDEFPKRIYEEQVTIDDAPWLGREYYDFGEFGNGETLTADDALRQFEETLELSRSQRAMLWIGTDYARPAQHNLDIIAANAKKYSIDLDALGYPLPTHHNEPKED